ETAMHVANLVIDELWELATTPAFGRYCSNIEELCVVATRQGYFPDCDAGELRQAVCAALGDESILWRGSQGRRARGLWRAPDEALVWWSNTDRGAFWCHARDVDLSTLDNLLASAEPALAHELSRIVTGRPGRAHGHAHNHQ